MRVAHVARDLDGTGGLETYVRREATDMLQRGHDVFVIHGGTRIGAGGARWLTIPGLRSRPTATVTGLLREALASLMPDVVICQHLAHGMYLEAISAEHLTIEFLHGFVCAGGKLFRRGDRVCTHAVGSRCLVDWYLGPCGTDPSPRSAILALAAAQGHLRGLRAVAAVAVPSRFLGDYVAKEGIDRTRIRLVDNSTGIGSPKDPVDPPRRRLIFVGRLTYNKGVQHLIRALAVLPNEFTLDVIGEGWYRPRLEQLSGSLRLEARIRYHGGLAGEQLTEAIAACTLGVVPSVWPEPAGLVVPELRAAGLPVVVSDVGGLPEWSERLGGIAIAPPADPVGLAATILTASVERFTPLQGSRSIPSLLEVAASVHREATEHAAPASI